MQLSMVEQKRPRHFCRTALTTSSTQVQAYSIAKYFSCGYVYMDMMYFVPQWSQDHNVV